MLKSKILALLFLISFISTAQEQDFELYNQFNGSYDFVMIGNTMNVNENTFPFSCNVLSESSASLNLAPSQEVVGAYLY